MLRGHHHIAAKILDGLLYALIVRCDDDLIQRPCLGSIFIDVLNHRLVANHGQRLAWQACRAVARRDHSDNAHRLSGGSFLIRSQQIFRGYAKKKNRDGLRKKRTTGFHYTWGGNECQRDFAQILLRSCASVESALLSSRESP